MIPKGIRLNNPGNIRKGKVPWNGEIVPGSDPHFCQFVAPKYGIRAIGILLKTYQNRYGIRTIGEAIRRYAPNSENDTEAYISDVCHRVGIGRDALVSFNNLVILTPIVKAIIWHENGQQPYSDELIAQSL